MDERPADLASLVRPDAVHRRVYTDPAIFELEMARIFHRSWLYVGHESEVPAPGDFVATSLGRQPVLLVRGEDGTLRVIHNRCMHRGSRVVAMERGQAREFRCGYHGWTYATDGRLTNAPYSTDNFGALDLTDPSCGLARAGAIESYRGFVFARHAADGPGLREHLGDLARSFDDFVDRAPDGAITVAGGVFRHYYDGNWKLYIENIIDPAHPLFVHESSIDAARRQSDEAPTEGAGEIAQRQMLQNGQVARLYDRPTVFAYDHGHSFMGDYHSDARLQAAEDSATHRAYRAALAQRAGETRAAEILAVQRWNSVVYPNLTFMSQFRQLRVIHPIAVDRTEVRIYSFRLNGAPAAMLTDTIQFANAINSPASLILTDDLEIYRRIQTGLASEGDDWVRLGRGFGRDTPFGNRGLAGNNGTSEVALRAQFRAWAAYMTGP